MGKTFHNQNQFKKKIMEKVCTCIITSEMFLYISCACITNYY